MPYSVFFIGSAASGGVLRRSAASCGVMLRPAASCGFQADRNFTPGKIPLRGKSPGKCIYSVLLY